MDIKHIGVQVTIHQETVWAGVDIKCLETEEATVEDLVIGVTMMEGEGAGEVVITGGVAGEEGLEREEGGEVTEVDQGPAPVGTLGIEGQILEGVTEVIGLVPVEISTDKAPMGLQDLQELQPLPPLTLTWDQILETWVLLQKTMPRLCRSFPLAWVEVVELMEAGGCQEWRISMPTEKKTAW